MKYLENCYAYNTTFCKDAAQLSSMQLSPEQDPNSLI